MRPLRQFHTVRARHRDAPATVRGCLAIPEDGSDFHGSIGSGYIVPAPKTVARTLHKEDVGESEHQSHGLGLLWRQRGLRPMLSVLGGRSLWGGGDYRIGRVPARTACNFRALCSHPSLSLNDWSGNMKSDGVLFRKTLYHPTSQLEFLHGPSHKPSGQVLKPGFRELGEVVLGGWSPSGINPHEREVAIPCL